MRFGLKKCLCATFNISDRRLIHKYNYYLYGTKLENLILKKTEERYLGIQLTNLIHSFRNDPTLNPDVIPTGFKTAPDGKFARVLKSKANRALGTCVSLGMRAGGLTPSCSINIYRSKIRSNMLYGSEIVDWEEKQVVEFEKIQAKSLRTLLGAEF